MSHQRPLSESLASSAESGEKHLENAAVPKTESQATLPVLSKSRTDDLEAAADKEPGAKWRDKEIHDIPYKYVFCYSEKPSVPDWSFVQ